MHYIIVKINHLFNCSAMALKQQQLKTYRMAHSAINCLLMSKWAESKAWNTLISQRLNQGNKEILECMLFLALIQVNKIGIWLYPSRIPMKANSANSCMHFIHRPLRTPEMAEMADLAIVPAPGRPHAGLEQHSHLFTIHSVSICYKVCNVEWDIVEE